MDNTVTDMFVARLDRLDAKIDKHDAKLEAHSAASAERYNQLDKMLRGNGNPGVITRLDRVEQLVKQIGATCKWGMSIVGTALTGIIAKIFS